MTLDEIRALDENYYMNTFGARLPVAFDHGKGVTLYDTEGRAYTDFFACIAVNALYFVCPQSAFTLHSVVPLLAVFTLWLVYALGAEHKWMHNRVIDFLSGISMEIYLCHMVMFRVVEKMHLERIINDENALFATVCILGIGLAAAFSYFMKLAIAKVLQGKSRIS